MTKEDKLILGTLAGVDLILSPEHYEEYKGTLDKQLKEKEDEIDRLNNIINELEKYLEDNWKNTQDIWYVKIINKLKELKEVK